MKNYQGGGAGGGKRGTDAMIQRNLSNFPIFQLHFNFQKIGKAERAAGSKEGLVAQPYKALIPRPTHLFL